MEQNNEEVRISPRTGLPINEKASAAGKKSTAEKRKRKSNNPEAWKNSPVIGMNGYNLKEGDNAKYLRINMELFNMPMVDLYNAEEVEKRLAEYFEI